jgi:hypothetical protein
MPLIYFGQVTRSEAAKVTVFDSNEIPILYGSVLKLNYSNPYSNTVIPNHNNHASFLTENLHPTHWHADKISTNA